MKLISPSSVLVTWDDQVADTLTLRLFLDTTKLRRAGIMQQSMYSPTHPTAGQPGGYQGVYQGVCCLFKTLGYGGFLKVCPQAGITRFVYIENHSDYSSDCYKIKVLILQNIEAVMFKFSGGVDVRKSYVQGDEGCQPCSR